MNGEIEQTIEKVKGMRFTYNELLTIAVTTAFTFVEDEKLVMEYFTRLKEKVNK